MSIKDVNILRPICMSQAGNIDLHGLSDASEIVFAFVIYIRFEHLDGSFTVRKITYKT